MFGAGHPLISHRMGAGAMKLGSCLLRLCLGWIQGRQGFVGRLSSAGDGWKANCCECSNEQMFHCFESDVLNRIVLADLVREFRI
jgi:hypothetical protein